MRRSIMIVLTALLALAMAAPTVLAQAGPPEDATVTYPPEVVATFPGHCDFDMQFDVTGKTKLIELPDGGVVFSSLTVSPDQYVTVTNLDNGKTATFNITGTIHTKNPDSEGNVETVLTGRNLALDPAVGTVITIGRFTFVFDAAGNIVQTQQGVGDRIDICELLS